MVMDSIREGVKKPWAKVLIFVIVISFVGAGYFTSSLFLGDLNAAAVVNGESISTQEFQRAYSRTRQQYGEAFKQFIKTEEQERNFRENVLQNLISRSVVLQTSQNLGMRVSDQKVQKTIHEMPALQSEGVYSSDQLDLALSNIRMSREQFKQTMVADLVLGQLSSGITDSEFVLPSESQNQYKLLGQLRTGRVLPIKYSLFDAGLEISEEEITSYYQENLEQFRLEEKISLEYIELSVDRLQKDIVVTEEQISEYYTDNLDRFQSDEQRRASHIVIASGEDENAALVKAESIKVRLDAGEDFVALVKSESSDEFSAENDGDLGVLSAGDMEESFELAMNALAKVGDISSPVKTSFGYHIIKLTELLPGETQSLEEVRDQITMALKKQGAEEAFYAKSSVLEEKSFEISDSLSEVSKLIEVDIQTSPLFSRNKALGIFANADAKEAAFSENVLEASMNSSLININDNHVVVVRLKMHQPSEIQPLEKVSERVVSTLKSSKTKTAAIEYGENIKDKLMSKSEVGELLAPKGLKWKDLDKVERTSASLPYLQLQKFFKMSHPLEDSYSIDVLEDNSEYIILVLNLVENGQLDKAEKNLVTQAEQRLTRFYGEADYGSLVEQQRSEADVTRNLDNINR